jgi:ribosomal protein S3AE
LIFNARLFNIIGSIAFAFGDPRHLLRSLGSDEVSLADEQEERVRKQMVSILKKTMSEEDAREFMRLLVVLMHCKSQQRSAAGFFTE